MKSIIASVVISTKDKNSRLKLVLLSLEQQMRPDTEVVIVFDGCKAETIQEFDKFKFSFNPVKVICEKNVGRSAARNIGVKKASGEIIIFIDDDRIPGPDFLLRHIEGHKKRCVVLGERAEIRLTEQNIVKLASVNNILNNLGSIEKNSKKYADSPNTITRRVLYNRRLHLRWMNFLTGNVSVPRADLIKAGLFDEKMVSWGHEDIDLGYRLYKLKMPFYHDKLAVNYHLAHTQKLMENWIDSKENVSFIKKKYKGEVSAQIGMLITTGIIKYCELMIKRKKGGV